MIFRFSDRLRSLIGWRRALAGLGLGAVSALALAPFHLVPLLVPAFVGLVWLLEGSSTGQRRIRRGMLDGFWFGFGHFFVGLHWIAEPLLVDPGRTAWLIPFALPGLAAVLSLFPALVCGALAVWRLGASPVAHVLALAGAWTVAEFVRGFIFTGFPWNLTGYVWSGSPAMLQSTAVIGILGLSAVTVVAASMPAVLAAPDMPARQRWVVSIAATIMLPAVLWAGGQARLQSAESAAVPDVRLRIVQANIAQRDKWNPELRTRHLERHVALSNAPADAPPTHVIWPETAVPFFLANDTLARVRAARAAPAGGSLLTGSVRAAFRGGDRQLHNAMVVVDGDADVQRIFDKSHLVPFGEYVPLNGVLPIDKIVPGQGDFVAGPGRRLIRVDGLPALSPLICYEAIFPGRVTPAEERPGWLLNLTNDAWFGNFAGPQQHFAITSTRAVEEGLPMVRAANTGISAVVDPYGRTLRHLGIGVEGVIDSPLPAALAPTPYARWGDWIPVSLALALLAAAGPLARRPKSA